MLETDQQPNDVHQAAEFHDFSDEKARKDNVETAPAGLIELGQSSSHDIPNIQVLTSRTEEELDGDEIITTDRQQQTEITLPISVIERMLMQNMAAEAEAHELQNLKNGLKISCLVISVSTTGILSFLSGFPRSSTSQSQSTMTRRSKLLFEVGILSMCASLVFALVLLTLSTNKAKFSGLNQTVRIIIWISTGLMTSALVLLLLFYLHTS